MTIDKVQKALAEIKKTKGDAEKAHDLEDRLYKDVLRSIADGNCDDPIAVSHEALKASKIPFPRWRA
jgi:hypothetical protein